MSMAVLHSCSMPMVPQLEIGLGKSTYFIGYVMLARPGKAYNRRHKSLIQSLVFFTLSYSTNFIGLDGNFITGGMGLINAILVD